MPQLSKHGKSRMKNRCGIHACDIKKVSRRAYRKGIPHNETTGDLHKYLDGIFLRHKNATNSRIYGDVIYLFKEDKLITALKMPENLMKRKNELIIKK